MQELDGNPQQEYALFERQTWRRFAINEAIFLVLPFAAVAVLFALQAVPFAAMMGAACLLIAICFVYSISTIKKLQAKRAELNLPPFGQHS